MEILKVKVKGDFMKVTCLFEQSGTFKNAFERAGHSAIDIDISNNFHETDYVYDLFKEFDADYISLNLLDKIVSADLVIAFFPCTWFSNFNTLIWSRKWKNFKYDMFKTEQDIDDYIKARREKYDLAVRCLRRMIDICKSFDVPLIIENPLSTEIIKLLGAPSYLDADRTLHGDDFKKPTAYYCYDCKITSLDRIHKVISKTVLNSNKGINRSLISPVYADNFVKHIKLDYVDIHDHDRIELKYD